MKCINLIQTLMVPRPGHFNSSLGQRAASQSFPALLCDLDLSQSPVAITVKVGHVIKHLKLLKNTHL